MKTHLPRHLKPRPRSLLPLQSAVQVSCKTHSLLVEVCLCFGFRLKTKFHTHLTVSSVLFQTLFFPLSSDKQKDTLSDSLLKWLYDRFGVYIEDFRFQPEEQTVETEEPLSAKR